MNSQAAEALLAELAKKDLKELTDSKEEIRALGLQKVAIICNLAIQKNSDPKLVYNLFSILASLLHPLTPANELESLVQSLLPLSKNTELVRYVRLSFAKCMATAMFHLLSPERIEILSGFLRELEPEFAMLFLAELCTNMRRSLDVPMMSTVNHLVLTRVLPMFIEPVVESFFQRPEGDILDIIGFCVTHLKENVLMDSAQRHNDTSCDVSEIASRLRATFAQRLPMIPDLLRGQVPVPNKTHVINFVAVTVPYGLDSKLVIDVVNAILSIEIDPAIVSPILIMVKKVLMTFHQWQPGDELFNYASTIGLAAAEQNDMATLSDVLSCLSTISTVKEMRGICAPPDPRISNMIPQWLLKQIGATSDEDDDQDGLYDDICMSEAFLSQGNPAAAFEVVFGSFKDGIDLSTCHWCLKLMNEFYDSYREFEHPFLPNIDQGLRMIMGSDSIWEYGVNSSDIAYEICRTFRLVKEPAGALKAFHMSMAKYGDSDDVMKEALQIARMYRFPIENIAVQGLPMTDSILQMAVSLSPSPSVIEWVTQLMSSGQEAQMTTAAYLVRGLLDANVDVQVETFIQAFIARHMFCEALKVAFTNPQYCCEILASARQWNTDLDARRQLLVTALKIAHDLCETNLTDLTMQLLVPELVPDMKVSKHVAALLHEHKLKAVPILPSTTVMMVNFLEVWLRSEAVVHQIFEGTLEAMSFAFEHVIELLSDDFWAALIVTILLQSRTMGADLLFRFAAAQFERYSKIMGEVLARVGDPGPLMELLHAGIGGDQQVTEAAQMIRYSEQLSLVAKSYQYLRSYL